MLEEFISVAIEAFVNANGDADKFELQLRRKLMTYTSTANIMSQPKTTIPQVGVEQVEKALTSIDDTDPIFSELENLDVHNMSDEDVIEFARRLGIMGEQEASLLESQEDE